MMKNKLLLSMFSAAALSSGVLFAEAAGAAAPFHDDQVPGFHRTKVGADEAARTGQLIGGQHLAFPSLGRLRKEGMGYVWIPLLFSRMP